MANLVRMGHLLDQLPARPQLFHEGPARFHHWHAGEPAGVFVHPSVEPDHRDRRKVVPLADLEVHRIVRRGDLHCTRAKARIDRFICDDGHRPFHVRHDCHPPDEVCVPLISRVDGNSGVREDRLWTRRRDLDRAGLALALDGDDRVRHVRQRARLLRVDDLEV